MKKSKVNKIALSILIASMMMPGPAAAFGAETSATELESQAESEAEEAAKAAAEEAAKAAEEKAAQEAAEKAAQEAAEKAAQEAAEKAAQEAAEKAAEETAQKEAEKAAQETEANKEEETAAKAAEESKKQAETEAEKETAAESKDQSSQKKTETVKETEAAETAAQKQEETEKEKEAESEAVEQALEEGPDAKADVEKESDWKKTLPDKLAHTKDKPAEADYRADIVAIAKSQVDYKESIKNYVKYSDGKVAQYSRYGAWFGENYADPWDAEFACFVLYYAGVPDVPYDGDTAKWTHKLEKKEMFVAPDYEAEAGDLIFLQEKNGPFHVGIVTKVGEKKLTVVAATVGESVDSVKSFTINKDDSRIYAYGVVVPLDPEEKVEEKVEETAEKKVDEKVEETIAETAELGSAKEDAAKEEASEKEAEQKESADQKAAEQEADAKKADDQEVALTKQKVDVSVYTDAKKDKKLEGISITLEGQIPENAAVSAYPVNFSPEGEEMYAAYQVTILDENGQEYHQQAGEGERIVLTINDPELYKVLENKETVHCWHKDGADIQDTSYEVKSDGSIVLYSDQI